MENKVYFVCNNGDVCRYGYMNSTINNGKSYELHKRRWTVLWTNLTNGQPKITWRLTLQKKYTILFLCNTNDDYSDHR